MKVYHRILLTAALPAFFACNSTSNENAGSDTAGTEATDASTVSNTSYVKLSTGEAASIVKDTETNSYIYSDTRQPIESDLLFVDASTSDTLYGPTGLLVNNALVQTEGTWKLDETKIKRDGDEIKIKSGDEKIKIDGEDMKVKDDDSKLKVDDDESKMKTPDTKEKTDDGETKVKPR